MHSEGTYLGLQGTRILVGFLRVSAVVLQKACMHTIGANNIRAGEGLTWRRQQINCTRIQVWVRARTTSSVVVVFTRCACDQQYNIRDSSRTLETSRHAAQQKSTVMKCRAAVVIQASAGYCAAGSGYGQTLCRCFSSWCIELARRAHFHWPLAVDCVYSCHL